MQKFSLDFIIEKGNFNRNFLLIEGGKKRFMDRSDRIIPLPNS